MKRTISILVIVAMMLASLLAIIPASAADPVGTPITNKAEFAAMDPEGQYYLANDIKLTDTYAETFKGVLDGNGHTITLSGATSVFHKVTAAEIRNLTVISEFTSATTFTSGALANYASGTFENLHADVDVTFTVVVRNAVGGLFGEIDGATTLDGCTSTGNVTFQYLETNKDSSDVAYAIGGLIGKAFTTGMLELTNCINYTDVHSRQIKVSTGGILGGTQGSCQVKMTNCVNYGDVIGRSGDHSGVGGFVGAFNANSVPTATLEFQYSRNYGNISTEGDDTIDCHIGGFLGRGYGPKSVIAEGCVNSGDITNVAGGWGSTGGICGGIMTYGFDWSQNPTGVTTIKNCANLGTITGKSFTGGIIGGALQNNGDLCNLIIANTANYGDVTGGITGGLVGNAGENGFAGFDIDNCYNSGAITGSGATGGVVGQINPPYTDANTHLTENRLPMTIDNFVNAGVVKGSATVATLVECKLSITINGCANIGEAVNLAPEAERYVVTNTPEDAAAAAAAVLAVVPASSASLDEFLIPAWEYYADDYKAGWDEFVVARDAANIVANSAQTADAIEKATKALKAAIDALVPIDAIDRSVLEDAIAAAADFEYWADDYTPTSWAVFEEALAAAKAVAEDAKQSAINMAANALNDAIAGLAKKPNFGPLDDELAKYADYAEESYTSATWAEFAAAVAAANALRDDPSATNDDVQEKITDLMFAALGLAERADTTALSAKLDATLKDYPRGDYTSDSYEALSEAQRDAQNAVKSGDVSAVEIKDITKALDAAIALLIKRGDLTEITEAVKLIDDTFEEELFTADSWAAFKEIYDAIAKQIGPAHNSNLTREDVAELEKELEAALELLVASADFSALTALIGEIKALNSADYTEESWNALAELLAAAELVVGMPMAQTDVNTVVKALSDAKTALVAVEKPTDAPTDAPTEKPTEAPKASGGCGGSVVATIAVVAVVATLGTAVLRKKED